VIRLCAAGFVAYCSYAICRAPLLPLLARELGATPPEVGLVVAASTITGVLLKLPAGVWSDILGRRPLLLMSAAVFALMPFGYLTIAGLGGLMALRFVHGSATAIMSPVMSATISDVAPADRRATWLSTYLTIQGAGQALAPIIAGLMIARGRYDLAFVAAGSIGIMTPFLVANMNLPDRRSHDATPILQRFSRGIAEVLRERRILIASVAHAAYYVMNGTLNAFLPLFAQDRIGMGAVEIGWLFGIQTVTTLAVRPMIGAASDRFGRRGAVVLGLIACAAGVWAIATSRTPFGVYVSVLLYAGGVAVTTAATSAYITDVAPRARYGAAHGVFGTIYDIGDAGGPLIGGVLVAAIGYTLTFQVVAAMAAITALVFLWLSRATPRFIPDNQLGES
jgi:MFS transporter, DHA1 family, multidrug resistance protein